MIICDLDGCISDDRWRRMLMPVNGGSWDSYHEMACKDYFVNEKIIIGQQAIIFTARPSQYRTPTLRWLAENGIDIAELYMRPKGNMMPSLLLKKKFLDDMTFETPLTDISAAYDDRQVIVDMYRRHGLNAQRVTVDEQ